MAVAAGAPGADVGSAARMSGERSNRPIAAEPLMRDSEVGFMRGGVSNQNGYVSGAHPFSGGKDMVTMWAGRAGCLDVAQSARRVPEMGKARNACRVR